MKLESKIVNNISAFTTSKQKTEKVQQKRKQMLMGKKRMSLNGTKI